MATFGERVKRDRSGMSRRKLAAAVGVAEQTLIRLENLGQPAPPKREFVEKLAAALGQDPAEYLTLAGYAIKPPGSPTLESRLDALEASQSRTLELLDELRSQLAELRRGRPER